MTGYIAEMRKLVGHRTIMQCASSIMCVDGQGQLLLGRRTDNHLWGYSGGSVEIDERVEDCARRELQEEMGLIAEEIEFFCVNSGPETHYIYPNGDEVSNVEVVYLCRKYHGELRPQESEMEELRYFDPGEISPEMISPPIRPVIDRYLREQGGRMRIETERLVIREFTPDMARDVHENSLDEDNRKFVPDEVFETVEEAAEAIAFLMSQYSGKDGPLACPVFTKDGGLNIGYVQLVPLEDGTREIGYHIAKQYTGMGYATEAVRAFLPVAADRAGIGEVFGICLSGNTASRRVLQKCGFRALSEGVGDYQGERREVFRSVWKKPQGSPGTPSDGERSI